MDRIIIAEDEERIAAFINKGLQKNGYHTAIAKDGEQALHLARSEEFDLLLLDLGLPIKDGWTVLAELEASSHDLATIIVSAQDDPSTHLPRFRNRIIDYISKPFRFADLLERITICLRQDNSMSSSTRV
ncbi:MAG: response regulator [Xenococcaceae cyanobacterium MO_234.B1]|nr:response regulator [Xenococcaceae cyanobacterium MO_234.B1]